MAVYKLQKTQFIPVSLDEAWDFFSHPKNLAVMTPDYLNLKFTNELYGEEMYQGQVMTYNVKPVLGIPMFWMTEITHVVPKKFFVDEQRFGQGTGFISFKPQDLPHLVHGHLGLGISLCH